MQKNPAHLFKILQEEEMRELGLGNKEIQGKKLNPNPFSLVFGLGKTPYVDKGVLYLL